MQATISQLKQAEVALENLFAAASGAIRAEYSTFQAEGDYRLLTDVLHAAHREIVIEHSRERIGEQDVEA